MIVIGGMIGIGIFKGSVDIIGLVGFLVIFLYLFVGLLFFIVMGVLVEMVIVYLLYNMKDLI